LVAKKQKKKATTIKIKIIIIITLCPNKKYYMRKYFVNEKFVQPYNKNQLYMTYTRRYFNVIHERVRLALKQRHVFVCWKMGALLSTRYFKN